jgi:glycosyltransferase involved in cell wall biosynthesis
MTFATSEPLRLVPRRIVIYRNELLPVSETFIRSQADALQRHVPVYVGLRRLPDRLDLGRPFVTLTRGASLGGRMQSLAYLHSGWSPGFRHRVAELRPSLLHAHFATDACAALPLVSRLPFLVTLHGYDVTLNDEAHAATRLGRIYLERRPRLFRTADAFFAVSGFILDTAARRGFPEEKLVHCPIGVDLDYFREPANNRREDIVLFVGRLVEKKGCAHLIRAMARVQAEIPSARLVIIGDGPLRSQLEVLARERLRNYSFFGAQPASVVRQWMLASRLFSVPSRTARNGDAEGLGIVFCEAQACGLPVVSFRSGGVPEAVAHGSSGLLAPEGDEAALAEYLSLFLRDPARWQDASRAARAHVEQNFDLRRQTELLECHYERLGSLHGSRRTTRIHAHAHRIELL